VSFDVQVHQNSHLAPGSGRVDAIVTVTASGDAQPAASRLLEVIVVDTSGSMEGERIAAARHAVTVAIDQLRPTDLFAVVAGHTHADLVFPFQFGMAFADDANKALARQAVARLRAAGTTCMSRWLEAAGSLFDAYPAEPGVRHCTLLSDGKIEGEPAERLYRVLAAVQGRFQCDARGVGADWVVAELRAIASTLLGTVDLIPSPAELPDAFAGIIAAATAKQYPDVALRLWSPVGATLDLVRQVAPTVEDLAGRAVRTGPLVSELPTGAWAPGESRDYHVVVTVRPGAVGDEMLAARASLVVGGEVAGQGLVRAVWTEDEAASTRLDPAVAHYTGQEELAEAIAAGLEARAAGDEEAATVRLGRAVQLAQQSGHDEAARLLRRVVDVEDAETGTVRLRRDVARLDEMALDTRSTRTVPVRPRTPPSPGEEGAPSTAAAPPVPLPAFDPPGPGRDEEGAP
jgi:hypothetical protein